MTQIYADGVSLKVIKELKDSSDISGFTTNPSLMKKLGCTDYGKDLREMVQAAGKKSISVEVISDNPEEIYTQSQKIALWGSNVAVKIPFFSSTGQSLCDVIKRVAESGVTVNVTAILAMSQIREITNILNQVGKGFISVFAGRIADTGVDPIPFIDLAVALSKKCEDVKVIWASPREILNITQATESGCDIITIPADLLAKRHLLGKDLEQFSVETSKMFINDSLAAGFEL